MATSHADTSALRLGSKEFTRALDVLASPNTTQALRFQTEDHLSVALRNATADDLAQHFPQVVRLARYYPHAVDKVAKTTHPELLKAHALAQQDDAADAARAARRALLTSPRTVQAAFFTSVALVALVVAQLMTF